MQRSILLFELALISGDNKKDNRTMVCYDCRQQGQALWRTDKARRKHEQYCL